MATKGYSCRRSGTDLHPRQELCQQVGEPLQVAPVLFGLWAFYAVRGNHTAALALGEQFLSLAHRQQDSTLSLVVHTVLGATLLWLGEFAPAQAHLEQAVAFYDPEHHRALAYHMGQDPGLMALGFAAETLWYLGYPDQALERVRHALSLAQALSHPFSLAAALGAVALVHLFRREGQEAQAQAEALLTLAHEHGFALWLGYGTSLQGWALVERAAQSGAREQREAGLVQLRRGWLLCGPRGQSYGSHYFWARWPGLWARRPGRRRAEGARRGAGDGGENGERWYEAELYRLKGELTLQQASPKFRGPKQVNKSEPVPSP